MGLFLPLSRATLLIPSGPNDDLARKHLFILLTDPCPEAEEAEKAVLLVCLSTVRDKIPHDGSCLLHPGDHAFVKTTSYVVYQRARIETANKLLEGVKQGLLVPQDTIGPGVFARICKGLEESRLTPPRFLSFYRKATRTENDGRDN